MATALDLAKRAAVAASRYWTGHDLVTMVAIAGAESNWNPNAAGDSLADQPGCLAYNCGGWVSYGLWQINMCAHPTLLRQLTGDTDPCAWAHWLQDPNHNAEAAWRIWNSEGFGAWSSWWRDVHARSGPGQGRYLRYVGAAAQAVRALGIALPSTTAIRGVAAPLGAAMPPGTPQGVLAPPPPSIPAALWLGVGLLLLGMLVEVVVL